MVASRDLVLVLGASELAFWRYFLAFLCLLPLLLRRRGLRGMTLRDMGFIALLGCIQFALLMICMNKSLALIPAGTSALIFALMPLEALLLAALLGRERLSLCKTLGVSASILGVGLALGEGVAFTGTAEAWLGVGWSFAATTCGAVCSVLVGPLVARRGSLAVGALAMASASAVLIGVTLLDGGFAGSRSLALDDWPFVAGIGVSSALAFRLWLWALTRISPTRVTVFLALGPVTALLLGAWFLAEPLGLAQIAGVGCVALGLWLAYRPDRAPALPASAAGQG